MYIVTGIEGSLLIPMGHSIGAVCFMVDSFLKFFNSIIHVQGNGGESSDVSVEKIDQHPLLPPVTLDDLRYAPVPPPELTFLAFMALTERNSRNGKKEKAENFP